MLACFAIDTYHVCISGFTQRVDRPTGLHELWLRLGSSYRNYATAVELRSWKADMAELAESIKISRGESKPTVVVYAYSWGAGWGFTRLAEELRHRDIEIAAAVLCDPVYRSRWLSQLWRSVSTFDRPTISIPDNVKLVRWLYQRTNIPQGHQPVAVDPKSTTIEPGVFVRGVTHDSMDDSDEFFEVAMNTAAEFSPMKNLSRLAARDFTEADRMLVTRLEQRKHREREGRVMGEMFGNEGSQLV